MPEIYTDDDLSSLFRSVTDPKQNLLYRLLLGTGLREQEAMFLEWEDIDTQTKVLWVHAKPKWDFRVKDFEERSLPLSEDMLARLMKYKSGHPGGKGPIFDRSGQPDGHMLRTLKRLAREAGLNCGVCDGCLENTRECRRWFLHKFRASYCTKLLRSGLDLRTVQQVMGHSDLASTMRYLRPAENVQTQARINTINWG
jgi:integrase